MQAIREILSIFKNSNATIRPHFVLTGSSGSGKTFLVQAYCEELELEVIPINAASLTKEGVSGSSLSRVLTPLQNTAGKPTVVLVDEFDKLFIAGSAVATENTSSVQDEFLKCLEDTVTLAGSYGSYTTTSTKNILFIFAGAFKGQEVDSIDKLREFGIRNEFIGRVPLVYHIKPIELRKMIAILENSELLHAYVANSPKHTYEVALEEIRQKLIEDFATNTIGARMVTMLIHMYFIDGFPSKSANQTRSKVIV